MSLLPNIIQSLVTFILSKISFENINEGWLRKSVNKKGLWGKEGSTQKLGIQRNDKTTVLAKRKYEEKQMKIKNSKLIYNIPRVWKKAKKLKISEQDAQIDEYTIEIWKSISILT